MPERHLPSLSTVLDLLLDAVCVVDADGRFVFVSAGGERIFGYPPHEMLGRTMIDLVHPEDRARTLEAAAEIMSGRHKPYFRNRYLRKDGSVVHVMWSARWSDGDRLRIAVARDVSELARAEAVQAAIYAISEAAHSSQDLPTLFQHIHAIVSGLVAVDHLVVALRDEASGALVFHHEPAAVAVDDPAACDAAETACAALFAGGDDEIHDDEIGAAETRIEAQRADTAPGLERIGVALRSHSAVVGAMLVQRRGQARRYSVRDRELLQFVSLQVATAIERKQAEARLQHIALYDVLTDLPNRKLFHDRLQIAMARARRNRQRMALLYVDLDGFKQVNDRLGHAFGDLLLREVAGRLRRSVRESDTVSRFGGDEFVIVLDAITSPDATCAVAEKVRAALGDRFELQGTSVSVTASIGISLYPDHGADADALLRVADRAMYGAKSGGGNRVAPIEVPAV